MASDYYLSLKANEPDVGSATFIVTSCGERRPMVFRRGMRGAAIDQCIAASNHLVQLAG